MESPLIFELPDWLGLVIIFGWLVFAALVIALARYFAKGEDDG